MYKHRDNIAYAPTTIDPSGGGLHVQPTVASATPVLATAPTLAGARKRGRDIRGIDRFRQVVFGENGFARLHAMAARNPVLMYPPEGIPEARRRHLQRVEAEERDEADGKTDTAGEQNGGGVDGRRRAGREGHMVQGPQPRSPEADDAALWAMFDERHQAELDEEGRGDGGSGTAGPNSPSRATGDNGEDSNSAAADERLANYHHQQLDTFLRLVYEFNHVTFVKLPIQDTLALLARCGKEAVAHVLEREVHLRMAREGKLRELKELRQMREQLQQRLQKAREASEEHELAEAERRQAILEQELQHPLDDGADHREDAHEQDGIHSVRGDMQSHVSFAGMYDGVTSMPPQEGSRLVDANDEEVKKEEEKEDFGEVAMPFPDVRGE